jgi:hypothetical protein
MPYYTFAYHTEDLDIFFVSILFRGLLLDSSQSLHSIWARVSFFINCYPARVCSLSQIVHG